MWKLLSPNVMITTFTLSIVVYKTTSSSLRTLQLRLCSVFADSENYDTEGVEGEIEAKSASKGMLPLSNTL